MAEEKLVRVLCVPVKPGESQEKLKAKVLKTISNSERKATPTSTSHPLQSWSEDSHCIAELPARDVVKVTSSSSHLAFLMSDGRACRLPMASKDQPSSVKTFSSLDALRVSGLGEGRRFQVIGDEEYAQQLQSELNSNVASMDWSRNRNISPPLVLPMPNGTSEALHDRLLTPEIMRSAVEEYGEDVQFSSFPQERWGSLSRVLPSLGMEQVQSGIRNRRHTTSERRGVAKNEGKKSRVWPEIGVLEWAVVKQSADSDEGRVTFVAMAQLHSEVLLVTAKDRALYSWSCASQASPRPHPLAAELGLDGERISLVESSDIRATVVTESGKIATFYDQLLRVSQDNGVGAAPSLVSALTHPASSFPELEKDSVVSLSVSSFLTSAITKSGKLLWWGLCPPIKSSNAGHTHSSSHRFSSAPRGTITDGILVRLRNGPPCGPNSIVFNESGLKPRVGKTMNIIEHSGLDPKTSILVKVYKDARTLSSSTDSSRTASLGLPKSEAESQFEGLEVWSLSDVVFLDDSPSVLGRVVTVDQSQAIVDISHASSESGTMGSTSGAQSTLKVFKLSEIEPCMDGRLSASPMKHGRNSSSPQTAGSSSRRSQQGSNGRDTPSSSCSRGDAGGEKSEVVSQHIAGLVQHVPVCLMNPHNTKNHHTASTNTATSDSDYGHTQSGCVHGYYPLAMRMTDSGPMVLLKRQSDGRAFLSGSGHSGFPSFMSSSFVSLNSRDGRLGRSTIEEESVSALDGGYEQRQQPYASGPDGRTGMKSSHPSILKLHKSQAMMLVDVNGHICSLSEGLRLKPPPVVGVSSQDSTHKNSQPLLPYKLITTQMHMVKKDSSVMVVVAVPQEQDLMAAVQSGDVTTVDAIIHQYDQISPSELSYPPTSGSEDQGLSNCQKSPGTSSTATAGRREREINDEDLAMPPTKRMKTSKVGGVLLFGGSGHDGQRSESVGSQQDHVPGLSVGKGKSEEDTSSSDGLASSGSGRGSGMFYELSVSNSNILHVCGQLVDVPEEKGEIEVIKKSSLRSYLSSLPSKSYEEQRIEYMAKFGGSNSSLLKVERKSLLPRRLWILDRLLKCRAIESVIMDLMCQHNREGHTPFLSAIHHKNYASALSMLKFLEKHCQEQPSLLERAVTSSNSTGLSALHLLLASLSPHFDSQSMVLHVSSFQLTTAQQLLKLFHVRYPSAYKAEVVKKGGDGGSDQSSGSSGGSGSEDDRGDETVESRYALGRRRRLRNLTNRRLRRNRDNLLPSSQSGRVYFSDVSELRAAAREMQGFRITSSVFRNTGFGTTQAISHLNVGLEPSSVEGADERDDLPYVIEPDRLQGNFFSSLRDSLAAFNRRKFGSTGPSNKGSSECTESSSEGVAYELLMSLLALPSLVTALDQAGEIPLAAAVHNPHCISKLEQLCTNSGSKDSEWEGSSKAEASKGVPLLITGVPSEASSTGAQATTATTSVLSGMSMSSTSSGGNELRSSAAVPPASNAWSSIRLMPYTSPFSDIEGASDMIQMPQISPTLSRDSSTTPTQPEAAHVGQADPTDMDTFPSPTSSQSDQMFDSFVKNLDDIMTGGDHEEGEGQGEESSPPEQEKDLEAMEETVDSNGLNGEMHESHFAELARKMQSSMSDSGSTRQSSLFSSPSSNQKTFGERSKKTVTFMPEPICINDDTLPESLKAKSDSESMFFSSETNTPQVTESRPTMESNSAVKLLFSDWAAIVMIVLGFDPSSVPSSESSAPPPPICSVHSLDNFSTDFLLNCSQHMITYFVDTVITRLNSALQSCSDSTLVIGDLDFNDPDVISRYLALGEEGVALLVGRRFLGSMVRVLALEHSRIKNRFLEMQQARLAAASQADEADTPDAFTHGTAAFSQTRGQSSSTSPSSTSRPRNTSILSTVIGIISRFSWLGIAALAQAAEGCSYPLRLGVSKPLGASSVVPDYQSSSRVYHSTNYGYVMTSNQLASRQGQSLVRQLHVRVARTDTHMTTKPSTGLPAEGLLLRPQQSEIESAPAVTGRPESALMNSSMQEDSSDEELEGMNDEQTTIDAAGLGVSTNPLLTVDPPSVLHNEVFLDLDSESSSEEDVYHEQDYLEVVGRESGTNTVEEDNMDAIYPFAWALDGRRIGENGVGGTGRSESPNSLAAMSVFNTSQDPPVPLCNIPSIRFGAGFLARTFARLVKDLVDISADVVTGKVTQPSVNLKEKAESELLRVTVATLEHTWSWAVSALDLAETQLVQGQHFNVQRHVVALRGGSGLPSSTSGRSSHSKASRSFVGSTPGEYVMSLLRSTHHEDHDCLPVIDLYGYEHVVYMLDGLLYSLKHWPKSLVDRITQTVEGHEQATPHIANSRSHSPAADGLVHHNVLNASKKPESKTPVQTNKFFKRTDSVLVTECKDSNTEMSNLQFFGEEGGANLVLQNPEMVGPPNTWEKLGNSFSRSLNEDYPLASQPHLLKPFAKKETLFREGRDEGVESGNGKEGRGKGKRGKKRKSVPPDGQGASSTCTMAWSPEYAHDRWHLAISVFAHIFLAEGPGNERSNFLNARAGFASRMARFRHQVSQLYNASQMSRDWAGTVSSTLSIRVKREKLMQDSLTLFKQLTHFHYSNVRVKFDGEDGSGPGVNRGFFASFSYELKSGDMSKSPLSRLGLLFHEPGKQPEQGSLFAPHPYMPHMASSPSRTNAIKSQRREAFVAVGRFLGFCLWFHYTVPFMVCRHVAKVLLGRPLAWHDLAFYNADLYEGLRQMMLDAELGKKDETEFAATYCSFFEAPLPGKFLEPVLVELIPGGSKIPVTAGRVHEYVRLYSMFMMVGCVQEELSALKQGLNDVIPNDLLSGLTAEDFQLLLSGGSAEITLSRLKSIITFNHTHKGSRSICDRFEKMFWRVVGHMNNIQRQQLLYFATGSAALPATVDTNTRGPNESLTQNLGITMDVITVRNVHSLPVASTCSQRMCIPLYPSYHILKKKLLQAIQCQAYGLG